MNRREDILDGLAVDGLRVGEGDGEGPLRLHLRKGGLRHGGRPFALGGRAG